MTPAQSPQPHSNGPRVFTEVRQTWLSREPKGESAFVSAIMTFLLVAGSMIGWSTWGERLEATGEKVFQHHEYYRLWTTLFVHGDAAHLAANTFLFFIFGFFLYGYFGWRIFPVAAFFWGGLANLSVLGTYDPETALVGASGVVYWMGGAYLILYFFLSRQKNTWHRWLRSAGVALLLFAPSETFIPNVSHRTHFAGFILGVAFGLTHYLGRRREFLAAEVHETVIEDADPGDDLPGPEGFPVHRVESLATVTPEKSDLASIHKVDSSLVLNLNPAYVRVKTYEGVEHEISQPVRLVIQDFHGSDGWPVEMEGPLEITNADLQIETARLQNPWPLPTQYAGSVELRLKFSERASTFEIKGRGLTIEAAGPGRVIHSN